MSQSPQYPAVRVKLTGTDGNAFAIIGRVHSALKKDISRVAADRFREKAFQCHSYDDLLQFVLSTVEVE